MSSALVPYLNHLPVELLYHILTFLDSDTILLSFRFVCQRFYLISSVYDRYTLNLQSCIKSNFYRFCQIINPENIVELTLSDDDKTPGQIALFLSFFQVQQFRALRSLTLLEIEDSSLNRILTNLECPSLATLSIRSRTFFTWTSPTLARLSSVLEQSSLRHFTFSIWCFEIYDFAWPVQCHIEHLRISNRITFEQYCAILERCLNLQTFVVKDVLWNDTNKVLTSSYRQLRSLTLEDNRMDIYKLEQFLSLTPSLTYLKVIGMAYLIDGYRWEKILRIKLSSLEKFEFFFLSWKNVNYDFSDIQSLIRPYQTSFWLENKQWRVNCDYVLNPSEAMLYSVPVCKSLFHYHEPSNKISCSNTMKINPSDTLMHRISELRVNLVKTIHDGCVPNKTERSSRPLFRHVNELILDLDGPCSTSVFDPLTDLLDLSSPTQLQLNLHYDLGSDVGTVKTLFKIFRQTSNVHTLEISNHLSPIHSSTTIEEISSLVPSYIKHLKITVKNINDMKIIFDRFEHLSSITFRFSFYKSIPSAKMIESFLNIKKDLTYRKDDCSIRVWMNKDTKRRTT